MGISVVHQENKTKQKCRLAFDSVTGNTKKKVTHIRKSGKIDFFFLSFLYTFAQLLHICAALLDFDEKVMMNFRTLKACGLRLCLQNMKTEDVERTSLMS